MKRIKYSKNKHMTDADIDRFCTSVKQVLIGIKDRSSHKKSKKRKDEDLLNIAR
jgi:hypothetical protein